VVTAYIPGPDQWDDTFSRRTSLQGFRQYLFDCHGDALEKIRILTLMTSHIELMFLYARKNLASAAHYRKGINTTVDEFRCYQAQIVVNIA
jgi:hypothetical protein